MVTAVRKAWRKQDVTNSDVDGLSREQCIGCHEDPAVSHCLLAAAVMFGCLRCKGIGVYRKFL
jgi:hypothetical protein